MGKFGQHRDKSSGFRRIRKPLTIACVVVLFFVFSNYYMGFFTAEPIQIKPVVVRPAAKPPVDIVDESSETQTHQNHQTQTQTETQTRPQDTEIETETRDSPYTDKTKVINAAGEGKDNRRREFNPPAVKDDKWPDPGSCVHTRDRDYSSKPIVISGRFSGKAECDVPCVGEGQADAAVGSRSSQCSHVKSIFFTMENSSPPPGSYDIVANTHLDCEVPLPYFSWAEYDFRRPVAKKTAKAHVAAFISNCGPQKRLQWMEVMQKHGIKIDSYGSCMHNKEIPSEYTAKYGPNYNGIKADIISTYKFVMAFENSATDDYVTEKLFGVLVAGSVPLYDGAPNGKKFGPSSQSMIFASDYGTPEKLAEYLLYLDSNDTAYLFQIDKRSYEEYLQWKKTGPSDEWVALVDLAKVHSNCRLCIRTADMHRKEVGPVKTGQPEGEKKPSGKYLELHVRERGKFWLRNIYLTEFSIDQLKKKINTYVPHDKDSYLFSIYDLWTQQPVTTDDDVARLSQKAELEAIFVVPEHWESLKLMW